jgi:multidrug resistance efflux pump
MKTLWILTAGSMALAGLGGGLAFSGKFTQSQRVPVPPVYPDHVAANGVVEGARPEVALRPESAGVLAALHVREDQAVTAGMLLAELRSETQERQLALARAELAIARAQLQRLKNGERREKRQAVAAVEKARRSAYDHARVDWDRMQEVIGRQAASREQADAAHFRLLRAQAALEEAQAERALVEAPARADEVATAQGRVAAAAAHVQIAEAELAKMRLHAPCSGRILQVYAEPGAMSGPATAQPILLLADLSRRRVRAFVEELDASRVRVGQRAQVTADGLPGRTFTGTVAIVLPRMGRRTALTDAPNEYKDLYFREALIDVDNGNELLINLRVLTTIIVTQ